MQEVEWSVVIGRLVSPCKNKWSVWVEYADAKDQAAADYYQGYGFVPAPDNTLLLFMPLPTIQQLFA
jgi:hypothetical protein